METKQRSKITERDLTVLENRVREATTNLTRKPSGRAAKAVAASKNAAAPTAAEAGGTETALPTDSYLLLQRHAEIQFEAEEAARVQKSRQKKLNYRRVLDKQMKDKAARKQTNEKEREVWRSREEADYKKWLVDEDSRKANITNVANSTRNACMQQLADNKARRQRERDQKEADEARMVKAAKAALKAEEARLQRKKVEQRNYMNKVKKENERQREIQRKKVVKLQEEERRINAEAVRMQQAKERQVRKPTKCAYAICNFSPPWVLTFTLTSSICLNCFVPVVVSPFQRKEAFEAMMERSKGKQYKFLQATKEARDRASADAERALMEQRRRAEEAERNDRQRKAERKRANDDMTRSLREQMKEKKDEEARLKREYDFMAIKFKEEAKQAEAEDKKKKKEAFRQAVANREFLKGQMRKNPAGRGRKVRDASDVLSDKMTSTEYQMNAAQIRSILEDPKARSALEKRLIAEGTIPSPDGKEKGNDEPRFW